MKTRRSLNLLERPGLVECFHPRPGVTGLGANALSYLGQHRVAAPKRDSGSATCRLMVGAMTRLNPQALNGSNDLQLAVFGDDTHDQILLSADFDNLGKGAYGAAVQNLSLMPGLQALNAGPVPPLAGISCHKLPHCRATTRSERSRLVGIRL